MVSVVKEGIANIPDGSVIFAGSYQGVLDGFVWITGMVIVDRNFEKTLDRVLKR